MMMLSFLSVGMFIGIKNRDASALMPAVSLVGVTIFLLLWEARARYILNFLPLFILMTVFGIKQLFYHDKNQ
jgi:predicted neutral ceramidase superfamily lipid hydrolase